MVEKIAWKRKMLETGRRGELMMKGHRKQKKNTEIIYE